MDRTEANRAAATRLVVPHAVVALLLAGLVVALLTTWWLGVLVGLVAAAAVVVVMPRSVPAGLDRVLGGRPALVGDYPRYHNLVDNLAVSSGIAAPALRVIDDPGLNLAVYGEPESAVIVATTGVLESLDRIELLGALAAAFARIGSYDAHLAAQATLFVCGPLVRKGPVGSPPPNFFATSFAAARARRLHRVLGPQREMLTDLAAIDSTRYPPGLGAALEKMESSGTSVASATWGTAHLWLADPLTPVETPEVAQRLNLLFEPPTPIDLRASLMAEL